MMKEYYYHLIGRVHKILPIYEKDKESFKKYIRSMYLELLANNEFEQIIQIGFKIKSLESENITKQDVKKTMFECRGMVIKIVDEWGE